MIRREDVTRVARTYVGTPFQHLGRSKGQALDCVGLALCVGEDLGILDRFGRPFRRDDYPDYNSQPVDDFVFQELKRRAIERRPTDPIREGDVLAVRIPHFPCHAAIAADRSGVRYMIHAYRSMPAQCVEHVISLGWKNRIVGVFEFPGVVD